MNSYVSDKPNNFRTELGEAIFRNKYALTPDETWLQRCQTIVDDVCGTRGGTVPPLMSKEERAELTHLMHQFAFIPGGRYIYYAGRGVSFYSNCFLFSGDEDTRQEWGRLLHSASNALMSGGGIGVDYSIFRERGALLKRTGGTACLPADTIVYKDRKKSTEQNSVTIGRLYELQETRPDKFAKIKLRSLDEETGQFYRNQLLGVVYNGKAEVFECKTENGYTIKATANHRFMDSSREYKELGAFSVGEQIAVNGVYAWVAPDPNNRYRKYACPQCGSAVAKEGAKCFACREYPACPQCGGIRSRKGTVCRSCAHDNQILETANDTTARQRKDCIAARKDYCELCSTTQGKFEVHHKDKNPLNNTPDNLINLCVACHNIVHKEERNFGNPYAHRYLAFDRIVSIALCGVEHVYDLQMQGPNHNFVANGFVSHNSGPLPLAESINSVGQSVKQGGSRRSACYGSLNWRHPDAGEWLKVKDWANQVIPGTSITYAEAKRNDFDAKAPLDFTNISFNYDNQFLAHIAGQGGKSARAATDPVIWASLVEQASLPSIFVENVRMALYNGEPGCSFNFFDQEKQTLRNGCTEVTSEDDSDVCNLGSVNMAACATLQEFNLSCELGSKFLVCGTIRGQLPDEKSRLVREKNRRLGLGLMGVHEWLLQRNHRYEMNDDLRTWLQVYKDVSESSANEHCDRFFLNRPVAYRAIAPTGTIGMLAGTSTGIEAIFAVAYKRRYIEGNRETGVEKRRYQYYIDSAAQDLMRRYGLPPEKIESAIDLAKTPERRIAFQADVQDYVDMAISSTLNLPEWGSEWNNESKVLDFAKLIAKYAPRLRGLTCYPDGARGGQPLTSVPLEEAQAMGVGVVFEENSERSCVSGVCGI